MYVLLHPDMLLDSVTISRWFHSDQAVATGAVISTARKQGASQRTDAQCPIRVTTEPFLHG